MNTPYVKKYDETGVLSNPIKESFLHQFPNREQRRSHLNNTPFRGNGKNFSLTISGSVRYARVTQQVVSLDGKIKTINHYVERKNKK